MEKVAKNCEKLQKIAESCLKLLKVAKSCYLVGAFCSILKRKNKVEEEKSLFTDTFDNRFTQLHISFELCALHGYTLASLQVQRNQL